MNHFISFMKATLALSAGLCVFAGGLNAQAARDSRPVLGAGAQTADAQTARVLTAGATLPLRRIMLFSSGIAYYEHSGALNGGALLTIPFKAGAINDALKSLVLNDPASANPSVTYQSEQTLPQTLRSLKIDLSDEPDTALILSRLRGAEVEIAAPVAVSGRILGIEYRSQNVSTGDIAAEPWLSLYTAEGLRLFNLKEISSLRFKDPQLNEDLGRALDLIMDFRNSDTRNLLVSLPGGASRQVSLSYVIPSPVWKVSYRLDLAAISGASTALAPFQGWAIVDNDSDNDWENVELSLVAGRPASFIQQLYPPYYLARPTLPLAIAGTAGAAAHDAGYAAPAQAPAPEAVRQKSAARSAYLAAEPLEYAVTDDAASAQNLAGGAIAGAQGSAAGDQFEFTVKTPVSLERRMSAMLPLVETTINGRKLLIFSGAGTQGSSVHPRLGAEITNTTGMKLPAGPITVYDGGTYAGDALIEFWNENEKRLISFGEDLAVSGTVMNSSTRSVTAVNVAGGVMTISRSQSYLKTYTFKNAASQSKQLVVEHQKTPGTTLQSPAADEQTPSLYRFTMTLPAAGSELVLMVTETRPVSEQISLLSLRPESLLTYVTNQEIPPQVRAALQRAVDLRQAVISAEMAVTGKESQRASLVTDQDRIRKNLEAAGSQTQQGQEYLKRLVSLDNEISALAPELEQARARAKDAQKAYEDYLMTLNL
jgi:hypothetical protein